VGGVCGGGKSGRVKFWRKKAQELPRTLTVKYNEGGGGKSGRVFLKFWKKTSRSFQQSLSRIRWEGVGKSGRVFFFEVVGKKFF